MNLLTQALATDDLDDALKLIMGALCIADGDIAGVVFSGYRAKKWTVARRGVRAALLGEWLSAEMAYAVGDA